VAEGYSSSRKEMIKEENFEHHKRTMEGEEVWTPTIDLQ
jgi:hypothetical protein